MASLSDTGALTSWSQFLSAYRRHCSVSYTHKATTSVRRVDPLEIRAAAAAMDTVLLIIYVAALLLALALAGAMYSGLFHRVDIQARAYPLPRLTLAYKFCRGPFHNVDPVFDELSRLAPGKKWMGMYYDNPYQVGTHGIH